MVFSPKKQAIGIFDSGMGGLTVMRQIIEKLPCEDIVYFGDTARLPYGDKSPEVIVRYVIESAHFLAEKNIKLLVIACNTASAHALEHLRAQFPLPIVEVIEPGALRASQVTTHWNIAVLGTLATTKSRAYEKHLYALNPRAKISSIACPLFVPLVEEGWQHHQAAELIAREYLMQAPRDIDTLLLGCTHYPILKEILQKIVGDKVSIVDSATTCSEKVAEVLTEKGLHTDSDKAGTYRFFASDNPEKFHRLGAHFLGRELVNKQGHVLESIVTVNK